MDEKRAYFEHVALMDVRLDGLRPGESVELSRVDGKWVTAERTGDGRNIRFVRHTEDGFEVIQEAAQ